MRGVFVLHVKFPTKTVGTDPAHVGNNYKTFLLQRITIFLVR